MPSIPKTKLRVTFNVNEDLLDLIDHRAMTNNRSRSQEIETLLKLGLKVKNEAISELMLIMNDLTPREP